MTDTLLGLTRGRLCTNYVREDPDPMNENVIAPGGPAGSTVFKDERKKAYLNPEGADRPLNSPLPSATLDRARRYRLGRLRATMQEWDCGALLLYDPVNIRYAFDSSNMSIWTRAGRPGMDRSLHRRLAPLSEGRCRSRRRNASIKNPLAFCDPRYSAERTDSGLNP